MKRTQAASIASISALAAGVAQGAVTYSGLVDTTISNSGATTSVSFDLNQDGTTDFDILFNSGNIQKPYLQGYPDSVPGSTPLARVASDGWYGLPVTPFGTMIDSSYLAPVPDTSPVPSGQAYLYQDNNSSIQTVGDWGMNNVTEGYVGLEMFNGTSTNFGWVRLLYNLPAKTLTLVDYAYETTPGEGIIAGATNEVGAPNLYFQPASQTVPVGASVQLSVVALANPAPAYQWRAGPVGHGTYTNLSDAGNISGSGTSNLTINGATPANMADYVVVVSNFLGVATTVLATLNVVVPVATPAPQVLFGGLTANFYVQVGAGLTATFRWQQNGVGLSDGGRIAGSATTNLQVRNLQVSDSGNYAVVLTSGSLSVTSTVSSLTVLPVSSEGLYDAVLLSEGPYAYYRLSDSGNPATSNLLAYENVAAYNGVYSVDVTNGVPGPRPSDGYPGFSANNLGALFTSNDPNSQITLAPWNLVTSNVTFLCWVNPPVIQNFLATVLWSGTNSSTYAGINYYYDAGTGAGLPGNLDIGYTWSEGDGSAANGLFWDSGIMPPTNLWSMVALVVNSSNTVLYVYDANEAATWPNGTLPATQEANNSIFPFTNYATAFTAPEFIGNNPFTVSGGTSFDGVICDLAVFNQVLSQDQLTTLYNAALGILPPVSLQITNSGNTVTITWGPLGHLEEATSVLGPWTTNTLALSPYTFTASNPHKFYRVIIP